MALCYDQKEGTQAQTTDVELNQTRGLFREEESSRESIGGTQARVSATAGQSYKRGFGDSRVVVQARVQQHSIGR